MKTVEAPAVSELTKLRKDHQALVKRVKFLEDYLLSENSLLGGFADYKKVKAYEDELARRVEASEDS